MSGSVQKQLPAGTQIFQRRTSNVQKAPRSQKPLEFTGVCAGRFANHIFPDNVTLIRTITKARISSRLLGNWKQVQDKCLGYSWPFWIRELIKFLCLQHKRQAGKQDRNLKQSVSYSVSKVVRKADAETDHHISMYNLHALELLRLPKTQTGCGQFKRSTDNRQTAEDEPQAETSLRLAKHKVAKSTYKTAPVIGRMLGINDNPATLRRHQSWH